MAVLEKDMRKLEQSTEGDNQDEECYPIRCSVTQRCLGTVLFLLFSEVVHCIPNLSTKVVFIF